MRTIPLNTNPERSHTARRFITRLLWPVTLLAAFGQAHQAHAQMVRGADIQIIDLSPTPGPDELSNARNAYRAGHIIRIVGGEPAQFRTLLGVGVGDAEASETLSKRRKKSSENAVRVRQASLVRQVMAVRVDEAGALHHLTGFGPKGPGQSSAWTEGFDRWV